MTLPWQGTTPEISGEDNSRYETPGGAQNKVNMSQEYLLNLLKIAVTGLSNGSEAAIARVGDPYGVTYDWLKDRLDAADNRDIAFNKKLTNLNIFSVLDFGAKGDGVTDDTLSIQSCIDYALSNGGGGVVFPSRGPYKITSTLLIRQSEPTTDTDIGSDVHFTDDMEKIILYSNSQAEIKAYAAMTDMIKTSVWTLQGDGSYSNFYTEFSGLKINGNNLATNAIFLNEAMHSRVERCNIDNVSNCISNFGYGVHQIIYNALRGSLSAINFVSGGDSIIMHNDVYIPTGQHGFIISPWGGNTAIFRNIFTANDNSIVDSNTVGIFLKADNAGDDLKAIGMVRIHDNAFDGLRYGVKTKGYSTSIKNVNDIQIFNNYVGAAGYSVTNTLAYLENSSNVLIQGNSCSVSINYAAMKQLVYAKNCENVRIFNNFVARCTDDAIVIENSTDCTIKVNEIFNFGSSSPTKCAIRLTGIGTYNNVVSNNKISQQVIGASINGMIEENSANYNNADWNIMQGLITTEYEKQVNASVFVSRLYGVTPPITGSWLRGAEMKNTEPASAGYTGFICTVAGTPGTWKGYGLIQS